MFGNTLTDDELVALLKRCGVACAAVMRMDEVARNTNGPKGACTPTQAGNLSAMFAVMAADAALSRGLISRDEWFATTG